MVTLFFLAIITKMIIIASSDGYDFDKGLAPKFYHKNQRYARNFL
jgi:hypothetical protein